MRLLAVAAAVVALAACKRELQYERVELPGFSIDLPKSPDMNGITQVAARTRYTAGSIKRGQPKPPIHVVQLGWQPGVLSTDEELVELIEGMATAMAGEGVKPKVTRPPRHGTVGGNPSVSIEFRVAPLTLELIETTCGARAIQIAIAADDPRAIVERVTGSFACHPDPAREAELASDRAPVGFDDLTGWSLVDGEEAGFGITDGVTMAFFAPLPETYAIDKIGFAKVLKAMIEVSLGGWTPAETLHATRHGTVRDVAFGRALSDGQELDVAASVWKCPVGPPIFGFTINVRETDPAVMREAATDILSRARCLRPGEAPPTFAKSDDEDYDEDSDEDADSDDDGSNGTGSGSSGTGSAAPSAPVAPAP